MAKDNQTGTALDVKMIYPPQGVAGQAPAGPAPLPNNGYVVMPGGQNPIVVLQQPQSSQPAAQPSLVVLALSTKDEKKEDKKQEISSVFQRL